MALLLWAAVPAGAQESSTSTQTTTTTKKTTTRRAKASSSAKIDINSASRDELEKLPGVGPATSQKIIDHRPYTAKSELWKRKIVSKSEYQKIKGDIIAHQMSATK